MTESFIKFIDELDLQDKLKYTTSNIEESSHLQNHELYKKNIVFVNEPDIAPTVSVSKTVSKTL